MIHKITCLCKDFQKETIVRNPEKVGYWGSGLWGPSLVREVGSGNAGLRSLGMA